MKATSRRGRIPPGREATFKPCIREREDDHGIDTYFSGIFA